MVSTELKNIVESIVFASGDEISSRQIKDIIDKSGLRISTGEVEESVNLLNEEYRTGSKSFEILKLAGGFSFATRKEYGRFIGKLFEDRQKKRLSPSALETLAIIAYKQPITRSEMEFIRGVNVDYIVNSLLEKEMITINGRSESPGRPILYGTTKTFLKVLGLNALEDLPKLKEINEILKNQEIEGITQADIDLFNTYNDNEAGKNADQSHQLELISTEENTETINVNSQREVVSENDADNLTDDESTDEESTDDEGTDEESTDEESNDEESNDEESTDEESTVEESTDEESNDEESNDEESNDAIINETENIEDNNKENANEKSENEPDKIKSEPGEEEPGKREGME